MTASVLRLDNDTAVIPSLIVKIELVDVYVNMYTTSTTHYEWQVVATTTGGSTFVLAAEPYSWFTDDYSQREKASEWAKERIAVVYERVLMAIQDAS